MPIEITIKIDINSNILLPKYALNAIKKVADIYIMETF